MNYFVKIIQFIAQVMNGLKVTTAKYFKPEVMLHSVWKLFLKVTTDCSCYI